MTRYREGRPYRVWLPMKGRRNEALDTFVYALAAAKALGLKMEKMPMPDIKSDGTLEHRTPAPPPAPVTKRPEPNLKLGRIDLAHLTDRGDPDDGKPQTAKRTKRKPSWW